MLVSGGMNDDLTPAEHYSAFNYYSLDLTSFVWAQITTSGYDGLADPALQNRYRHCMACDEDTGAIYLLGGEVNYGQGFVVDCWELAGSVWTEKAAPPEAVQDSKAIVYSGQLIVSLEDGNFLFFDGSQWTTETPPNTRSFFYHTFTLTNDNELYVCSSDNDSLVDAQFFVWSVNGIIVGGGTGTGPGTIENYSLYACPDHLPTSTGVFTKIFDFGGVCGVCKFAVLNDRIIITEGLAKPPLVWGGCMADDASDWMHPKAVLVSQDGQTFYDVSNWVCNADPDTVAQVGGIRPWGYMAFCTDMPIVEGFYFDVESPNEGVSGVTSNTFEAPPAAITSADDITRQDLRNGIITNWVQSSGASGHFAQVVALDEGQPTVDEGSGKTGLPCTGQPFSTGDSIVIAGTTNYNGTYTVDASSTADVIVIVHAYTLETIGSGATATRSANISLGTGNQCPDVIPGTLVEVGGNELMVTAVTGDGTGAAGVALSAAQASAAVTAIYGIQVTANGATINSEYQNTSSTINNSVSGSTPLAGYSIRMVIPGSSITQVADHIQITLKNAASMPPLPPIAPGHSSVGWWAQWAINWKAVSIVPRSGSTADGTTTPTPVTFNNGKPASSLGSSTSGNIYVPQYSKTWQSDKIQFSVTPGEDLLLILDLGWSYNPVWDGRQFRSGELPSCAGTSYIKDYGWGNAGASADQQTVTDFTEVPFVYGLSQFLGTDILAISPRDNVAVTTNLLEYNTNQYEAIDSVTVQETKPGTSTIFHAVSFDGRNTFAVFLNGAWKSIVQQSGGTWQYLDGSSAWQNASSNTLLSALRQALAISANQMTGAQVAAITSVQWSSAGGFVPHITQTLDFAFRLEADQTTLTNLPTLTSYTLTYETSGSTTGIMQVLGKRAVDRHNRLDGWNTGQWQPTRSIGNHRRACRHRGLLCLEWSAGFLVPTQNQRDKPPLCDNRDSVQGAVSTAFEYRRRAT